MPCGTGAHAIALGCVLLVGWPLRAQLTLRPDLIVGVNGAYYLVQVRALLRDGALAMPDFPVLFYLQAGIAALLATLTSMEEAVVAAVRWTDTLIPVLLAIPVCLFARAFTDPDGPRARSIAAVWLVGLLAVGTGSLLRMAGDFSKNAAALPVSLLFIYFLYLALERRTTRDAVLAAICFAVSCLTHVGVAALNVVVAGLVGIFCLPTWGDRSLTKSVAGGLALALVAAAVTAYAFDPDRMASLIHVITDPGALFSNSGFGVMLGLRPGLPPGAVFGREGMILGNLLGVVGIVTLVAHRRAASPVAAAIIGTASATALLFASPLLGVSWSDRLALMGFVPGLVPLTFLVCRRKQGWILASLIVAPVLVSTILTLPSSRRHMLTGAARDELVHMKSALPEGTTLVVARHGLEWWAAWTLDTRVANRASAAVDVSDRYDSILLLDEISPNAFEWGRGLPAAGAPPAGAIPFETLEPGAFLPDPGVLRSKEISILYSGEYFRLSTVADWEPTPVWEPNDGA